MENKNNSLLVNRMVRAAKLDVQLYEEVEADPTANTQALMVVLIASLASSIGSAINIRIIEGSVDLLWMIIIMGVPFLLGWLAWAVLAFLLGTTIFRGPNTSATIGELLRTIGFAHFPMVLGFFKFTPILGGGIDFVGYVWFLIAGVIAVRQALDFSTIQAIATCVVGLALFLLVSLLISLALLGGRGLF